MEPFVYRLKATGGKHKLASQPISAFKHLGS